MKFNRMMLVSAVLMIGLLAVWGCPKKTDVSSSSEPKENVKAAAAPSASPGDVKTSEENAGTANGLKPVYFDFNKAVIREDDKAIMKTDAEWLKANPAAKVRIAGNCDERGTAAYNQALGERRAESAKKYLAALGISGQRMAVISYGKEKPVCSDHDEACWQRNRRGDLVVVTE